MLEWACSAIEEGNKYLLSVHDVHDDTALKHLGQTGLDGEIGAPIAPGGAIGGGILLGCHCDSFVWRRERAEANFSNVKEDLYTKLKNDTI